MQVSSDLVDEAGRNWSERHGSPARFRALTSLVRSYAVTARAIDELLAPLDLTLSRFEVLLTLSFARPRGLPMTRLRTVLMVHGSSVTYLVDRLVEARLAERASDSADRRVSLVRLTPLGRERIELASQVLIDGGFGPLAGLDEGELETLAELLAAIRR